MLIGAVLIPGARAPFLVNEAMVKGMKPGTVILDLSIDQGGCVETSRPTTCDSPTFKFHGVTHYCVPNMTTNVPTHRLAGHDARGAALPHAARQRGALRGPCGRAPVSLAASTCTAARSCTSRRPGPSG